MEDNPTPEEAIEAAKEVRGCDFIRVIDITPLLEKKRGGRNCIEVWGPHSQIEDFG